MATHKIWLTDEMIPAGTPVGNSCSTYYSWSPDDSIATIYWKDRGI